MSKVSSVIGILRLLGRKPLVSLGEIVHRCRVSERTAYRYIQSLQSAGMPITYDRKHKAYRLDPAAPLPAGDLRLDQAVLMGLALQMLAASLNESQRAILEETWQQISLGQSQWIKDAGDAIGRVVAEIGALPSMECAANVVVLQLAAIHRKPVTITCRGKGGHAEGFTVSQPSLGFDDSWYVREHLHSEAQRYRVDDILSVRVE